MAEKDRVTVTNHQGQTREVEPVDLERWAKKGYFFDTETKIKKKKEKSK